MKQNIILIMLDTHRADRLGFNGYSRPTSPNLDEYARSATIFERAIAPAQWTIPSHASIFSGVPPSIHQTTQANSVLADHFVTFAELLAQEGYETVGFCNNPLVGLIHNNLKRGFQKFYNYSGTTPDIPMDFPDGSIFPFIRLWEGVEKTIRKMADPIQNRFATSNVLLQAATNPFLVPLWTRFVHFKGNTARSIRNTTQYLARKEEGAQQKPFLLFLNLMETHLPFMPPHEYAHRFAPYLAEDKQASSFIANFNKLAMHWLIPLKRPFLPFEERTLSDLYDAEVAYQDHLLGELLEQLQKPALRNNSLVIITADHGEMLGEHQFMGHGFGVYRELIQVPLLIHQAGQEQPKRIPQPVLITRLFHTVLAEAGIAEVKTPQDITLETQPYSLLRELTEIGAPVLEPALPVISEAFPPMDAVRMMERSEPELIAPLHTNLTHRAIFTSEHKLYDIENTSTTLLNHDDEIETHQFNAEQKTVIQNTLHKQLVDFVKHCQLGAPEDWQPGTVDLSNPLIEQRLRDLGYMA